MAIAVRLKLSELSLTAKTFLTWPRFHSGCRPDLLQRVNRRKSKPVCEIGCQGGPRRSSSMPSLTLIYTPCLLLKTLLQNDSTTASTTITCIPLFGNNLVSCAETLVRLSSIARCSARGDCLVVLPLSTVYQAYLVRVRNVGLMTGTRELRRSCRWPHPHPALCHPHSL